MASDSDAPDAVPVHSNTYGKSRFYLTHVPLGPSKSRVRAWLYEIYNVPGAAEAIHVNIKESPGYKPRRSLWSSFRYNETNYELESATPGFRTASMQWRGSDSQRPWYLLPAYDFLGNQSHSYTASPSYDPRIRSGNHSCVQVFRLIRLEDIGHGQVKAEIRCETFAVQGITFPVNQVRGLKKPLPTELDERWADWTPAAPGPLPPTGRFMEELAALQEVYYPLRTARNLKQIFMLQVHHAQLNQYTHFLLLFEKDFVVDETTHLNPRLSAPTQWILDRILADSHLYQMFTTYATDLVLVIESLIDVVVALQGGAQQSDEDGAELAVLVAEVRGCCRGMTRRLARMSDNLDHALRLFSVTRDMKQSNNVNRLTLLATAFLPLSLSAGVLSMQTRFRDLGSLLYDFFGVVVLLAAVVAVLLAVLLGLSRLREAESKLMNRFPVYRIFMRKYMLLSVTVFAGIWSALVLSSFAVGLFDDVVLGAKIFGYGTLAAVGLPVAPVIVGVLYIIILTIPDLSLSSCLWWRNPKRKQKQKDLESSAGVQFFGGGAVDAGVEQLASPEREDQSAAVPGTASPSTSLSPDAIHPQP